MNADDLLRLARAMGYTGSLDTTPGYGVQRVVLDRPLVGSVVFNPIDNGAQALEVQAWVMSTSPAELRGYIVRQALYLAK